MLKLGFIANFLSRSVLIGFLTGVGIQVAMGQVGGMFGIPSAERRDDPEVRRDAQAHPDATPTVATLAVSVSVLATIVGLGRVNKAIPGALIAVVVAIAASYFLDLAGAGRHGPRDRARRPAARSACPTEVMTTTNDRGPAADGRLARRSSSSPRARRRRAPTR